VGFAARFSGSVRSNSRDISVVPVPQDRDALKRQLHLTSAALNSKELSCGRAIVLTDGELPTLLPPGTFVKKRQMQDLFLQE